MTSHLALMSCLLVLLLSLDKFLLHYLKKRWLSPRISTSPSKSRRSMAAAAAGGGGAKWSETAMLVIDMQVCVCVWGNFLVSFGDVGLVMVVGFAEGFR